MKKTKSSNPARLIAFFLTGLLLICTFGFTADGWHLGDGDSGNIAGKGENIPSGTPDDDGNGSDTSDAENPLPDEEAGAYIPEFINRITGLETDEKMATGDYYAFVLDGSLPSFGIADADLFCRIPTEDGGVRSIAFIHEGLRLWKVGSIAKSRGYILNIAKFFGGICISAGVEDKISYNQCDVSLSHIDISLDTRHHYTEFQDRIYTNSDLLASATVDGNIGADIGSVRLPYDFRDFGSEPVKDGPTAKKVNILRNDKSCTELIYNEESGRYMIREGGLPLTDSTNGKQAEFTNCFVLFADSVIYDNPECSQMVMDTIGRGVGYYFSGGVCTEIFWSSSAAGEMCFSLEGGERLSINRGNLFITFEKSSQSGNIIIE